MNKYILIAIVMAIGLSIPFNAANTKSLNKKREYSILEYSPYQMLTFIIKSNESFSPKAYPDGNDSNGKKRFSVGWGTKGKKNQIVSLEQANIDFKNYLEKRLMKDVEDVFHLSKTEPVIYACLCDLAYNRGSIPKKIKELTLAGKYDKLAKELKKNKYAKDSNGKVLPGLKKRRAFCSDLIMHRNDVNYINKKIKERQEEVIKKINKK